MHVRLLLAALALPVLVATGTASAHRHMSCGRRQR